MFKDETQASLWHKVFLDNYNGATEQARELGDLTKKAVKGGTYVPWATMQRMIYQQDPYAYHEVLYANDGTAIHSFKDSIATHQFIEENKDGALKNNKTSTGVDFFVHMVRVKVCFLGKELVEDYPIQDATVRGEGYISPKAIDGNLVNNALKRAFTKAFSMVSGLALRLYERLELQFETDEEEKPKLILSAPQPTPIVDEKPIPAVTPVVPTVPVTLDKPIAPKVVSAPTSDLKALATELKSDASLSNALKKANTSVAKKFGFTLSQDEPVDDIADKLSKMTDPKKFIESLRNMRG